MSNITFDIKCIRADPQAGICEQMISSAGATPMPIACALPDTCIGGPLDTLTTVQAAVAAGFNRIRIRGNVMETVSFALTGVTHIWIDGGIAWTINPDITINATAAAGVTVEGNSVGTLVFSRTTLGSLFTGATPVYTFNNLNIDYSATTVNNVQIVPRIALQQQYNNLTITLPNIADLRLFDFPIINPDIGLSLENIVFVGTGTNTSAIIGNLTGTTTNAGNFSNIVFQGVLPIGDGSFTNPLISVRVPNSVGNCVFQGLHCTTNSDIIVAGHTSNVTRAFGAFNVRMSGRFSKLESSAVGILDVGNGNLFCSDIFCDEIISNASGSSYFTNVILSPSSVQTIISSVGNTFTGCTFSPTMMFSISGNDNTFTGCTLGVGQELTIEVTGSGNNFGNCRFQNTSLTGASFIRVTGSSNTFTGCSKTLANTSNSSFEIGGTSRQTIIIGCNWVGPTTGLSSTIIFTGTPDDIIITTTVVDMSIPAFVGNVFIGANIVV